MKRPLIGLTPELVRIMNVCGLLDSISGATLRTQLLTETVAVHGVFFLTDPPAVCGTV
jgi:hypothetical protein